jgi:hypothetical protein
MELGANPVKVLWRLVAVSSGRVKECQIFDHSPASTELRIVRVSEGVTVASGWFTGIDAAVTSPALLAAALRADGGSTPLSFTPD